MNERNDNGLDWAYGLEEYFKFASRFDISHFIHELINLSISDNPYPTLKKLLNQAHSLDAPSWVFQKSVTFFVNLIERKSNLIEFASVARYYFNNEKLFRIIHSYGRNEFDIDILSDSLSRGQLKSKIWLVKELISIKKHFNNVLVMAGWLGQFKMIYANRLTYRKIRIIDLDEISCRISDENVNSNDINDYKVKSVCADINKLNCHKNGYELEIKNFKTEQKFTEKFLPDLIVNTSAEHMTDEWYNQIRFKGLESDPIVAIQSNNMFDIPEHINCVHSIEHMKKKFPMKEILYEGELQLKGYKRVMLIGKP